MTSDVLLSIRDAIQQDPGRRGLAADPASNLITECAGDFAAACHSLANSPHAAVAIVTGFLIPTAQPPSGETDGPLGALFLARRTGTAWHPRGTVNGQLLPKCA